VTIVSGQLLAFTSNAIIADVGGESGGVWRYMLVIATIPAVVLWFGMLVMHGFAGRRPHRLRQPAAQR